MPSVGKDQESRPTNLICLIENDHAKNLPYLRFTFEKINGSMVRNSSITPESHGYSGLDAKDWQKPLTPSKASSTDLCKTKTKQLIRIASSHLTFPLS